MRERPWLKSYPEGVVWDQTFEPFQLETVIDEAVAEFGDHLYLDFLDREFTYAEVGDMVDRAAMGLQNLGIGPGVKVGLFLPNCPQFVIAYWAILKAGGTVVNFSPLYSSKELLYQIEDSETDYMISLNSRMLFESLEAVLYESRLKKAIISDFGKYVPAIRSVGVKLLARKDFVHVAEDECHMSFEALMDNDGNPAPRTFDPYEEIAVLQYTGGTTGVPKGAMLTHANLSINMLQGYAWDSTIDKGTGRIMTALPLFHAFAMTGILLNGTMNGSALILIPKFEPDAAFDLIVNKKPTHFPAVPTMYMAILAHPDVDKADLSSLQRCYSGGAPLPAELKARVEKRLEGVHVREGYGLTETSPLAITNPVDGLQKIGSIGLPVPGTDLMFTDPDDPSRILDYGETGEIRIKGPQVTKGYWKRPEATAEAIIDGWLRTGDIGYMDDDGYTFIVDRQKDMIIVGGFNVFPRNVEEAIHEHPAVSEVTVIGVPDDYLGERPKAFVVLKDAGSKLGGAELKAFLADKLGKHEMPREIEFRDSLPKTPVGKLSKKELAEEERAKYEKMKARTE